MQSLPVLYITAENHYDVGKQIGSTFKAWIQEFLDTANDMAILRKFYKSADGKTIYDEYVHSSKQCYPDIVSEIQGMADGSGQSFEDLFLLQITSEVSFCLQFDVLGHKLPASIPAKGCTDILINSDRVRLIGHNDDWTDDVATSTYIVHVTIYDTIVNGDENGVTIKEEFVSYAYPGSLPGFCFGMNKDLVISLNSLMPKKTLRRAVPLQILLRRLLACRTVDECVKVMENKPVGCAYGMNINIARINDSEMCSMEVFPRETGTEVALRSLPVGIPSNTNNSIHHQNHYKYIGEVDEIDEFTVGSKRRQDKVQELDTPSSEKDLLNILGDTSDDLEPVFSRPNIRHIETNLMTSATAIFNITERRLDVYRTNPRDAHGPCLSIPFLK